MVVQRNNARAARTQHADRRAAAEPHRFQARSHVVRSVNLNDAAFLVGGEQLQGDNSLQ